MFDDLHNRIRNHPAWQGRDRVEVGLSDSDIYQVTSETVAILLKHGITIDGRPGEQNIICLGRNAKLQNLRIELHGHENAIICIGNVNLSGVLKIEGKNHLVLMLDTPHSFVLNATFRNHNAALFIGKGGSSNSVDILIEGPNRHVCIGDDVQIAAEVMIRTSDSHGIIALDGPPVALNPPRSINVDSHVWLGRNVVIQKGVSVGQGAIVALGSTVTKDVPAHTLVAGVPAIIQRVGVTWTRASQPSTSEVEAARAGMVSMSSKIQAESISEGSKNLVPSPIFIMSFDRPNYLTRVLESIRAQSGCDLSQRKIILAQDGAVNPYSKRICASQNTINDCINVFLKYFPDGTVMASSDNLGVALNYDRCEVVGFETFDHEAIIFLEDDLELGRHYLSTLDGLIDKFKSDTRVGYVAAYGDHRKTLNEQRANKQKLIVLEHNWGFALYRRQWMKMRDRVLEYLNLVRHLDYRDRNRNEIRQLFASWGYGCPADSQDAAKTIACCVDGIIKVNTYVCNAAYIGEQGLHMNEKIFEERGYRQTAVYLDKVTTFEPLTDELYKSILSTQRGWAGSP